MGNHIQSFPIALGPAAIRRGYLTAEYALSKGNTAVLAMVETSPRLPDGYRLLPAQRHHHRQSNASCPTKKLPWLFSVAVPIRCRHS
jgi:hypothetical protein